MMLNILLIPGITIIQSDISFQMVKLAKNNKKYNSKTYLCCIRCRNNSLYR